MDIPVEQNQAPQGYIPEQMYRARCIGVKHGKNSKGNQMTTMSNEIIEPETVEISGKQSTVAGRQFQLFLVHNFDKADGFGSQSEVIEFHQKLGVPFTQMEEGYTYRTELVEQYYKGMEFDIILRAKEDVKRYQTGPDKGQPILDGEGKEISGGMRIQANLNDVPPNCHPVRNKEVAARPY